MVAAVITNTLGLLVDIIGAILLWKFGLPVDISRLGHIGLILEQEDEKEKRRAVIYEKWGRFGLCLLILGFVFQAISNFL